MCKFWGLGTVYDGRQTANKLLWRPQIKLPIAWGNPAECLTLRQSLLCLPDEIWKTLGTVGVGGHNTRPFLPPFISFLYKLLACISFVSMEEKKITIPFLFSFRKKLENFGSAFKRWEQERRDTKTTRRNQVKTHFGALLWARGFWDIEGISSKVSLILFCFSEGWF